MSGSGAERDRHVFISSTSGDLAPYRRTAVEVCHRMKLLPEAMEEFDPATPPPSDVSRERVRSCGVFVLLTADRYGSRPPYSELSYTELEYQWAVDAGASILAFVAERTTSPPGSAAPAEDAEALERFVQRVQRAHVTKELGEVSEFRENLLIAPAVRRRGRSRRSPQHHRTTRWWPWSKR